MRLNHRDFTLACKRHRQSASWEKIVAELHFDGSASDLEDAVREHRATSRKARKGFRMIDAPKIKGPSVVAEVADAVEEVEAPTIVGAISGDPPPNRSALFKRTSVSVGVRRDPLDDLKHPLVFRS